MDIVGTTLLFGMVGDPIAQVKTPELINPVFARRNLNIISVPLHVSREAFDTFWQGVRSTRSIVGFGVTLPHKERAYQLCDELNESAERTGVVNVVKRSADGVMKGGNFDGVSFVEGLRREGVDLNNLRVCIVGAGGAAMAIAFALIDAGVASLTVNNRTAEKAVALVERLAARTEFRNAVAAEAMPGDCDLVINATSLGMKDTDPLPVDLDALRPGQIVAEVVAKPEYTQLLLQAKDRGCKVHSGLHMIRNQMDLIADFVTSDDPRFR